MSFVLPVSLYEDAAYNNLRRAYILLVASLIEEYLIDTEINDHAEMIIAIEKSCYDHAVEIADHELLTTDFGVHAFEQLYRTRVMRITKNLDINAEVADEHLATCLLAGTIDPTNISKLENKELSPMHNEHLLTTLNTRMNQKVTLKTSSLYRCRQCGKRETTVRMAQMRSTDEGETACITCSWCGYKWFN